MSLAIKFTPKVWEEYLCWEQTDKTIHRKINELIKEVMRHPFEGKGLPESLKNDFAGLWSRRIDGTHRLVYKVTESEIEIRQCRYTIIKNNSHVHNRFPAKI